jgi:HSP20 family protein
MKMLVRGTPFDLLDRDFGDWVRRAFGEQAPSGRAPGWAPALDVFTADGELHVRVEVPGIDPERDVDIEVADGRLTIRGDRRHEEATDESGYWRRELSYGHFERTVILPQGVDASHVRASYDAGILDVAIPLPTRQSSKVKVEIGPARRELEQS